MEEPLSKQVAKQIGKDKSRWADFMMKLELDMKQPAKNCAAKSAGTIALTGQPVIKGTLKIALTCIIAASAAYLLARAVS